MVMRGRSQPKRVIVLLGQDAGLALCRVRLRDRLAARLRATALDRELAAGASPESSVALAVHAGHLCEPAQRRLLSHSLVRVVTDAESPESRRVTALVCRGAVREARAELVAVAERLLLPGPVGVHGV